MDSLRSASVLKNMRTLHLRIKKHSENAMYLSTKFEEDGIKIIYPGLKSHPQHELYKSMYNKEYGFGGMLAFDVGSLEKAAELMDFTISAANIRVGMAVNFITMTPYAFAMEGK